MRVVIKILILCYYVNGILSYAQHTDSITNSYSLSLGISFPPVADEAQRQFTTPLLHDLNIQHIRFAENWKYREPTEGEFNWNPLDKRIAWAEKNKIKIFLTIQSNGPTWACTKMRNPNSCVFRDSLKFKHYITQLLQRYPNKIYKIQFGNEWQTDYWYIGSAEAYVRFNNIIYRTVQRYSPQTKMVLGGFSTLALKYLTGCAGKINSFHNDRGELINHNELLEQCNSNEMKSAFQRVDYVLKNAKCDEIDVHLYDDADNWEYYVQQIRSMVDKPIIVSEFGGPNIFIEPNTENYQSDQLELYVQTLRSLAVFEAYYFKLVEGTKNPAHINSGLVRFAELEKKKSYYTFRRLTNTINIKLNNRNELLD